MDNGADVVKFSFESSSLPSEPTLSNPNPKNPTPSPKSDEVYHGIDRGLEEATDKLDDLAAALNGFEKRAKEDLEDNTHWVDLSQAIDSLVTRAEKESGQGADSLAAAMDSLARGGNERTVPADFSAAMDNLSKQEDSLAKAIEKLADQIEKGVGTREPRESAPRNTARAPVQSSFLDWLSKFVTKPAIQAAQTPTLFRNNLIVAGLGGLNKLASLNKGVAAAGGAATGGGAASAVTGLASAAATATGALIAVPASIIALGTAVVATTQVMDAAVTKLANSIIQFSPEVAIATQQRELERFQNARERSIQIGPEIADLLLEFQDIDTQLYQLTTNLFALLNSPTVTWALDQVEGALKGVNGMLEYLAGMNDSLASISREYERDSHQKMAREAKARGLDEMAYRLQRLAFSGGSGLNNSDSELTQTLNDLLREQGYEELDEYDRRFGFR